ncbi:OmpA family protein [Luteirhabdus pelagi]|uniref:OmpA family protein n=1 Tax=Luteirhabdus pelagi TaxID=2792783 RepID=UPI00293D9495|nr:OmpA family protein [Luteirhabdus pelagi]
MSTTLLVAQNKQTEKADELYEQLAYTDAAEAYLKLVKKGKADDYVYTQLGNSYYYINDTKNAERYYKRVVDKPETDAEIVYNYAQVLKANQEFSEYNSYMKKFAQMKPNDSRAKEFMKNPNYIPMIMEGREKYTVTNLKDLNSKYSDFGGTVVDNDFYFASGRNTSRKTYNWNEEPFLDLYKAQIVGNTVKNANLVEGDVNTKYHESNAVISADGKRMYFDRNDYYDGDYDKSSAGVNQINLFYADKVGGEWKDIQSAPFNNDEYSVGHPALSKDGNTLYFSSDMPGGMGGADLYKVSVSADGTFGEPVNLGSGINTEGKEVFPFVDDNGTLYFSSDGHLGLGGLDVFYAEASGSGFGDVENMGKGINSPKDDFAIRYDSNTNEGYVSSNRSGGKGSDDIYGINKLCEVMINVMVKDSNSDQPLSGATVALYDSKENRLATKTTDANGMAEFVAACDQDHVVQASLSNYESNATEVDAASDTEIDTTIALRPIEEIIEDDKVVLNPIYFEFDKSNIRPQAAFELDKLVTLMEKYPDMKIKVESHTDIRGSDRYNQNLSERRAQSTVQYVISKGISKDRISGEGFGEQRPINTCGMNCTEEEHLENRRSEFIIVAQ